MEFVKFVSLFKKGKEKMMNKEEQILELILLLELETEEDIEVKVYTLKQEIIKTKHYPEAEIQEIKKNIIKDIERIKNTYLTDEKLSFKYSLDTIEALKADYVTRLEGVLKEIEIIEKMRGDFISPF